MGALTEARLRADHMTVPPLAPARERAATVKVWAVQTTKAGVTDDLTYGWDTWNDALGEFGRFLKHVVDTHPGCVVDTESYAVKVTYPDGQVRYIDLIRKQD